MPKAKRDIGEDILTREETLRLLSEFALHEAEPMRDRLKAVELLGKMQCYFGTEDKIPDDDTGVRDNLIAMFEAEGSK